MIRNTFRGYGSSSSVWVTNLRIRKDKGMKTWKHSEEYDDGIYRVLAEGERLSVFDSVNGEMLFPSDFTAYNGYIADDGMEHTDGIIRWENACKSIDDVMMFLERSERKRPLIWNIGNNSYMVIYRPYDGTIDVYFHGKRVAPSDFGMEGKWEGCFASPEKVAAFLGGSK